MNGFLLRLEWPSGRASTTVDSPWRTRAASITVASEDGGDVLVVGDARLVGPPAAGSPGGDLAWVARALLKKGPPALASLDGGFALAAWDPTSARLHLARDALGLHPLYLWRGPGVLAASSCPRRLARLPGHGGRPCRRALAARLVGDYDAGASLFEGIEAVPPGEAWVVTEAGTERTRFWDPSTAREERADDPDALVEVLRATLGEVFAGQPVDPDRVAAEVSGGMDSTTVSWHLGRARSPSRPPRLVAYHFPTLPGCDEVPLARRVAQAAGGELRLFEIEDEWLVKGWDHPARPRADPFLGFEPVHRRMLRELASEGVQTLWTGHGGDSMFTGPAPPGRRWWREPLQRLRQLGFGGAWRRLIGHRRAERPASSRIEWYTREARDLHPPPPPLRAARSGHGWAALSLGPLLSGLRRAAHLLDRLGAEAGVEVRHPLLSRRLADLVLSLPPRSLRLGGRPKGLLRAAMRGRLPDEVVDNRVKPTLAAYYHDGLRRERAGIEALFRNSHLEALGLVDVDALTARVDEYFRTDPQEGMADFWAAWMVEAWLQQLDATGP